MIQSTQPITHLSENTLKEDIKNNYDHQYIGVKQVDSQIEGINIVTNNSQPQKQKSQQSFSNDENIKTNITLNPSSLNNNEQLTENSDLYKKYLTYRDTDLNRLNLTCSDLYLEQMLKLNQSRSVYIRQQNENEQQSQMQQQQQQQSLYKNNTTINFLQQENSEGEPGVSEEERVIQQKFSQLSLDQKKKLIELSEQLQNQNQNQNDSNKYKQINNIQNEQNSMQNQIYISDHNNNMSVSRQESPKTPQVKQIIEKAKQKHIEILRSQNGKNQNHYTAKNNYQMDNDKSNFENDCSTVLYNMNTVNASHFNSLNQTQDQYQYHQNQNQNQNQNNQLRSTNQFQKQPKDYKDIIENFQKNRSSIDFNNANQHDQQFESQQYHSNLQNNLGMYQSDPNINLNEQIQNQQQILNQYQTQQNLQNYNGQQNSPIKVKDLFQPQIMKPNSSNSQVNNHKRNYSLNLQSLQHLDNKQQDNGNQNQNNLKQRSHSKVQSTVHSDQKVINFGYMNNNNNDKEELFEEYQYKKSSKKSANSGYSSSSQKKYQDNSHYQNNLNNSSNSSNQNNQEKKEKEGNLFQKLLKNQKKKKSEENYNINNNYFSVQQSNQNHSYQQNNVNLSLQHNYPQQYNSNHINVHKQFETCKSIALSTASKNNINQCLNNNNKVNLVNYRPQSFMKDQGTKFSQDKINGINELKDSSVLQFHSFENQLQFQHQQQQQQQQNNNNNENTNNRNTVDYDSVNFKLMNISTTNFKKPQNREMHDYGHF